MGYAIGDEVMRERSSHNSPSNGDQGYRRLDAWKLARDITIEVHQMTLESLPKFELYEVGSQIQRSAKSVRSNIVEGFEKRVWKKDFLRHLTYAIGSCDETIDHLETLRETNSLRDSETFIRISENLDHLKRKLIRFRQAVEKGHNESQ